MDIDNDKPVLKQTKYSKNPVPVNIPATIMDSLTATFDSNAVIMDDIGYSYAPADEGMTLNAYSPRHLQINVS